MKCGVNQGKTYVCMCGEKQKKGGTHYAQDCMDVVMAAPVCLMFWDVFVKTRLVQSQKQKEILTRLSAQTSLTIIVCQSFQKSKIISGFSKLTAPLVHQSLQTKLQKDSNDVDCLVWPSQSSDLNIIENSCSFSSINKLQPLSLA